MILDLATTTDRDSVSLGLLHAGYFVKQEEQSLAEPEEQYRLIVLESVKPDIASTALDIINLLKREPEAYKEVCMYIQKCISDDTHIKT